MVSPGLDTSSFVEEEVNDNGFVIQYSCASLVQSNTQTANPFEIDFYYELGFPLEEEEEISRQRFEFYLLRAIAKFYRVEDGNACVSPPQTGTFYLVEVKSEQQSQDKATIQALGKLEGLSKFERSSLILFVQFLTFGHLQILAYH